MKKLLFVLLAFAIGGAGIWFFMNTPEKTMPPLSPKPIASRSVPAVGSSVEKSPMPKKEGEAAPIEKTSPEVATTPVATPVPRVVPSVVAVQKPEQKPEVKDGVDGNISQPGDDGDLPPPTKALPPPTLANVKSPNVWLVASDLRDLPGAAGKENFEVGNPEGSKATPWKNRAGTRYGDGVRVRGSTTATFVRGLTTAGGSYDAVALCAPGAKNCVGTQPTQLKMGLDINHKDHWLSGSDKMNQSNQGGSSFTLLFVAARGSANGNPILEHQNGEAAGNKGVFFGWIGPDLVASIHGLQAAIGVSAVSSPNAFIAEGIHPQIYSLRFDRKKSDLKLFSVSEKSSDAAAVTLAKGDGPDNDGYTAIAFGSRNPGAGAVTYVFEGAAYSRALGDSEICAIHKEWNQKYKLKIPAGKLKPCAE